MIEIWLGQHDGGTAWRHALDGKARAGWESTGPLGLARRLGVMLGVNFDVAAQTDRVAAFAARLDQHDDGKRSYSRSSRVDRLGVATHLLSLRDALCLAGWRGQPIPVQGRLTDLSSLETLAGAPPLPRGQAEVLRELIEALARTPALAQPVCLRLSAPLKAFSPLLQALLSALQTAGATVEPLAPDAACAPSETDLGRLQRSLRGEQHRPLRQDGSVLLLEADTPLEAAAMLASYARTRELSRATFVVPAEGVVLDAALARQGLATTGMGEASRWRPALQLLSLRIALAFEPRDPLVAAELLLLPGAPLPAHARRGLLDALRKMPGLYSPDWTAARAKAALVEARLGAEIDAWFGGPEKQSTALKPAAAARLCDQVAGWAERRAHLDGADPVLIDAAAVARRLARMLSQLPIDQELSRNKLEQLHDDAVAAGAEQSIFAGEAGRAALCSRPSGVLAGAAEVVWWGFGAGLDSSAAPPPWTVSETSALRKAGVDLPEAGAVRALEAWGWKRPILLATERVVLVRWHLGGPDAIARHPFEDELRLAAGRASLRACTINSSDALADGTFRWPGSTSRPAISKRKPAVDLEPRGLWKLPVPALQPHTPLSASSLAMLFGCPLTWVLKYKTGLREGTATAIPDGDRLRGNLGHLVLQEMLEGEHAIDLGKTSPEKASAWAQDSFDECLPFQGAPLLRPGHELERTRAREGIGRAAAELVRLLQNGGWRPVKPRATEVQLEGVFSGLPIRGAADLVVERKTGTPLKAVIDLKNGGSSYRRTELGKQGSLQLALYAQMVAAGGQMPATGYFILKDALLHTVDVGAFPDADHVQGPSDSDTLKAAQQGFAILGKVLAKGLVSATGAQFTDWKAQVEEQAKVVIPDEGPAKPHAPCQFCQTRALCDVSLQRKGA